MSDVRPPPMEVALRLRQGRYSGAAGLLLAGSVVRGDATETSDLDVVLLYPRLHNAYRESFVAEGWPVEAFVHDPETLRWFFEELERKNGQGSLLFMVGEGVPVGDSADASEVREAQLLAQKMLAAGPPVLDDEALRTRRYSVTDVLDDVRGARGGAERVGAAVRLYDVVAELWLRSRGHWAARGKAIPRALGKADAAFAQRFVSSFSKLFAGEGGGVAAVEALCDEVLRPLGGRLFDGHRLDAPASWRRA